MSDNTAFVLVVAIVMFVLFGLNYESEEYVSPRERERALATDILLYKYLGLELESRGMDVDKILEEGLRE